MLIYNKKVFILFFLILMKSCNSQSLEFEVLISDFKKVVENKKLTETEFKNWHHKSIVSDSIMGISSEAVYDLLPKKKEVTVIVAVLDLEVNIKHPDLQNKIWVNKNEIPNNNKDDDGNGYIDDIHGWNFLGTTNKDSILYQTAESTRIVRTFQEKFKEKEITDIHESEIRKYNLYKRAVKNLEDNLKDADANIVFFKGFKERYIKLIDTMNILFKTKDYTLNMLDSLEMISKDSIIKTKIIKTKYCVERKIDESYIDDIIKQHEANKRKKFNLDYFDRITLDNPLDINDKFYGNNNVLGTNKMSHGTKVSGVIGAIRNNNYGVDGIANNVKLMPIIVSANGSEYDKDIALGIRYAVDNGAKIINMSIGKDFSMNKEWITEAIKYAEAKDVLLISAAGNEWVDLDDVNTYYYPNDMDENKNEISNNFIVVSSSNNTDRLVSNYSNYGQNTVDIFAPGENIKVLTRESTDEDSGTSLSCAVVSGVAALIRSYYPNLTASEVKQIIMESGVTFDLMVSKPSYEKEKELVPFSSLSKSGKVVNAYNALLMAEEVSKKKKKHK
ncbi:S8 family serine peptidase [Kordia sp. YSTF-M3]|uniref:S8 family serine peptidase n=1 Tax=Kordia aestuariivivens TaxID=2759037 RepID=A0ABR7Q4R3_9FLAO|nr:S8 family peptidase [Kordia aestuariivivens]MBC8753540.1 S8 family serine peptidase [Kordia aestuariivivens]